MEDKIKLDNCRLTEAGVVKCDIDEKNLNTMMEKKINPSEVSLTRKQDEIKTEVPAKSDSVVPAKSKSCGCSQAET